MYLQTLLALFPLALAAPANPLRGSPSLAGYSASNNVPVKNSTGVKYDLVPGQKDKAEMLAHASSTLTASWSVTLKGMHKART